MQMLGGKKQKITLLFTDIRGFTSMAEQMSPEEIVGLLNEYFSQMSELILTYQGTLDKFMGDAIMALYGAPIIKMDDSLRAVTTAVEMQKVVNQINESRAAEGLQTIAMGIGLNTGECIVGNIGSEKRLEYTAIGDSVNIASRLCSAAKGGQILISESTYLEMAEMIDVKVLDPINVKGKADALKIYEVTKLR
jgi:adenylate cyclase